MKNTKQINRQYEERCALRVDQKMGDTMDLDINEIKKKSSCHTLNISSKLNKFLAKIFLH